MALVATAAALAAGLLPARTLAEPSKTANDSPPCVRWRAEARYRNYGYDHLVTVLNGCEAPAVCTITTNVNPDPITVPVAPGKQAEVLTFRGSPAREFEARVRCALEASAGSPAPFGLSPAADALACGRCSTPLPAFRGRTSSTCSSRAPHSSS